MATHRLNLNLFSLEQLELGRKLFTKPCAFVLGCASVAQIPDLTLTEVAFAGRSNVGKSSLINALTNQKSLARTSNTPGRTREINFFNLHETLMLADLPGYGYARVSKAQVNQWTKLVNMYLKGRANLRRTFVLVDARHNLKNSDIQLFDLLDKSAQSYQLVLTKCDKVKPAPLSKLTDQIHEILTQRPAAFPEICQTSCKTGEGIPHLRATLAMLAPPPKIV